MGTKAGPAKYTSILCLFLHTNQPQNCSKSNKARPRPSKKAWIPLDSLGGNEPFQGVALTPQGEKSILAPFLAIGLPQPRFPSRASEKITRASNFHKQRHRPNSSPHAGAGEPLEFRPSPGVERLKPVGVA